jgi:anti-sigma regulatory factor (Ser/Thr protein kinase)
MLPPLILAVASDSSTGVAANQRRFSALPTSVAKARRFAVRGIEDTEVASRVATVVSELATNAVRHAKSAFIVEVNATDGHVRVAIRDISTDVPRQSTRAKGDPTGRGLMIVEALADRWGFHPDGVGKVVWAEFDS